MEAGAPPTRGPPHATGSPSIAAPSRGHGALAGTAAVGLALGVGELLAGLSGGASSPVTAIGSAVIERVPGAVERAAIEIFGTADKLALNIGIVTVALVIGAGVGVLARRALAWAVVGFVAFGALGIAAGIERTTVTGGPVILAVGAGVVAGIVSLRWLLTRAPAEESAPGHPAREPADDAPWAHLDRRRFLGGLAAVAASAAITAAAGRLLAGRALGTSPVDVTLPPPSDPVVAPPPAASFDVPGLTPLVVPNEDFYRIDTALMVPRVDLDGWRLRITGMVESEQEFTYDDLTAMPQVERYVTIACVSNEVGGGLVGNAAWSGIPLRDLLELAGVSPGATQIVGRAVDGWTAGFPTEAAFDGREALVALGMNGEPLPRTHGFPARLIVPGLYGYVSATKWLEEIELTTLEAFDAYWVPRGWAKLGPVHTQSRIDVPGGGTVTAGEVTVAGVAWAPDLGIEQVEVQVDDEPWQPADVSQPLSDDAWVQWRYRWQAQSGRHRLRVRATDGTGAVQTEEVTPPFPDGATGYHTVRVTVA